MAITAFTDNTAALLLFCQHWNLPNPVTRPVTVTCASCGTAMRLAFAADTVINDTDTRAYLAFEVLHRGWKIDQGKPLCPQCRHSK